MNLPVPVGESNAWKLKNVATCSIVAQIVGDDRMNTVVDLFWGLAQALHYLPSKENPEILVKSMHTFAKLRWATDDFFGENTASIEEEILEFTDGEVSPYILPDEHFDSATDAELSITDTSETGTSGGEPGQHQNRKTRSSTIEQLHTAVRALVSMAKKSLNMHEKGMIMKPAQIRDFRRSIDTLEKRSLPPSEGLTVVTELTVLSTVDGSARRDKMISPLTLPSVATFSFEGNNGFGSAENGLSITFKGLACCFQQLQLREVCPQS